MTTHSGVSRLLLALAHLYRRIALYYLREHERASCETLAECIAGWVSSGPGPGSDAGEYERVRVRLHHIHLPKLADADLIRYDDASGMATLASHPPAVDDLLTATLTEDAAQSGADVDALLAADEECDG